MQLLGLFNACLAHAILHQGGATVEPVKFGWSQYTFKNADKASQPVTHFRFFGLRKIKKINGLVWSHPLWFLSAVWAVQIKLP